MPAEWQAKADAEYRKHLDPGRSFNRDRIRFVTYTTRYGECGWVQILAMEKMYERALVDATKSADGVVVTTENVRFLELYQGKLLSEKGKVTIDDQMVAVPKLDAGGLYLEKVKGKWTVHKPTDEPIHIKGGHLCGPIDDAFSSAFVVVGSTKDGWHAGAVEAAKARQEQFARLWDKYFRGTLPATLPDRDRTNLVLFGDPQSNPKIAEVLPKLPITWTADELVVNGVKYDPKTHLPVLIYPNPLHPRTYVVLNSGHTFGEADLKGTNALLYPRLGDWAVIKPTPTDKDPAAFEVVAAGLFDENWQFPKK
jgi:hypothetical protein